MKRLSPLLLLLTSACALMSPAPPADDLYVLKAHVSAGGSHIPLNILVDTPEAAPGLDSQRIAVIDAPHHLTYYTGAAWARPLPDTLQAFFADALQQSHRFESVSSSEENVTANATLLLDVQDYEVVLNDGGLPSVHVRMVAKLVGVAHTQVASIRVDKTETASANHMPDIVAAFNRATNEAAAGVLRGLGNAYTGK